MDRAEELVYYNNLFDLYGNLLNEREKEIFLLYYGEDLSLQEIASVRNVSKSAIGQAITTINKKLDDYEKKLGFLEKISNLKNVITEISDEKLKEKIKIILENNL